MRGTLQPRGSGTWRLRVDAGRDPVTGRRRVISRTIRTPRKREAEAALAALVTEVAGQDPQAVITFGRLLAEWLDGLDVSPLTRTRYDQAARVHLLPALGDKPLDRLGTIDLDRLYRAMTRAGHAPASVRKVHQVASTALEQAVDWGWLRVNPARKSKPPKVPRGKIRPPTPEVVRQAFAVLAERDPELAVFVHLAAVSGCRRGELCALRWGDLDHERATLSVSRAVVALPGGVVIEKSTKTDTERRLRLPAVTLVNLDAHRLRVRQRLMAAGVEHQGVDSFVFPAEFDPRRPTRPDRMTARWMRLRGAAGASGVRLHDLRHHAATQLVAGGVDVRTVMDRMGWTSMPTAQRYIHAVAETDAAAAAVFDRLYRT